MKIIIAGSRDFDKYDFLKERMDDLLSVTKEQVEIVSGTARGADKLGEQYAKEKGFSIKQFPADWDRHGKSAGFLRNMAMAEYASHAVIFWDGKSRGSKHMIDLAKKNGLNVRVVRY